VGRRDAVVIGEEGKIAGTLEEVTVVELATRNNSWRGDCPCVWSWDGRALEVFSWITGNGRYHRDQGVQIDAIERRGHVWVYVGYPPGGQGSMTGRRGNFSGAYYEFDQAEYDRLRPLLDKVNAEWNTAPRE